jgi:hypothetical protein
VFPEGVPGECYGFGCIRRRDAYLAMKKSGYIRTAYIFTQMTLYIHIKRVDTYGKHMGCGRKRISSIEYSFLR